MLLACIKEATELSSLHLSFPREFTEALDFGMLCHVLRRLGNLETFSLALPKFVYQIRFE